LYRVLVERRRRARYPELSMWWLRSVISHWASMRASVTWNWERTPFSKVSVADQVKESSVEVMVGGSMAMSVEEGSGRGARGDWGTRGWPLMEAVGARAPASAAMETGSRGVREWEKASSRRGLGGGGTGEQVGM
jgi:hypothetical protein